MAGYHAQKDDIVRRLRRIEGASGRTAHFPPEALRRGYFTETRSRSL
ncbi:hypothetical protein AB0I98_13230 [Streptomyces sp. NPDC050211]